MTNEDVGFGELRHFIDVCISPGEAPELAPFLVRSFDGISALIDLLESRVADPLQEPGYISMTFEERQCGEDIARLSRHREEINARLAQSKSPPLTGTDETFQSWLNDQMKLSEKSARIEAHLKKAKDRLEAIQNQARDFLARHSSTVQIRAVERLRSRVSDITTSFQLPLTFDGANSVLRSAHFAGDTADLSHRTASEDEPADAVAHIPAKFVPWTLLDPRQPPWEQLIGHFSSLKRVRREEYDIERLKFVYDFKPDEIYVGKAAFEGYVVFCFAAEGRAVLECPKVGNALYLMQLSDWKTLSQLSKTELLHSYPREVSRITHSEQWRYELELWIKHGGAPLLACLEAIKATD